LKAESRIIFERCTIEYVIVRASFELCMGDKLMEHIEGGKKDDTFFRAL
jgi:hypothetical protein